MDLIKADGVPRHCNLVYTSAGDRSNMHLWLTSRQNFDLWVSYYGDSRGSYRDIADYYNECKGSKFQNLHYVYRNWGSILDHYEAVMVMDDDILIDGKDVSRLFDIREELDLWVLQPAFNPKGKISWDITRVRPTARLRYTNFVEMTCPLFRKDKLDAFMAVYDPSLVGFGMDWWFLDIMGSDLEGHVAVIDEITCVNPHDRTKGRGREIDRLQSLAKRITVWEQVKTRYGIRSEARGQIEYRRIGKSPARALASAVAHFPDWAYFHLRRAGRRFLRAVHPEFRGRKTS